MRERGRKILVVEPDPELLEVLVGALSARFDAHITCVAGAEACLDVEVTDPHDLVIAEMELPDCRPTDYDLLAETTVPWQEQVTVTGLDGLRLAGQLTSLSSRPIILLADEPTSRQAIEALRLGVRDIFAKPFPVSELLDAAERLLRGFELRRQHLAKYHRMRELVRRVIRERRDLNQRIELICRDLVGAHRRLVHRVLDSEESSATPR